MCLQRFLPMVLLEYGNVNIKYLKNRFFKNLDVAVNKWSLISVVNPPEELEKSNKNNVYY